MIFLNYLVRHLYVVCSANKLFYYYMTSHFNSNSTSAESNLSDNRGLVK